MTKIKWTKFSPLDEQTVEKLENNLMGVYRLTYLSTDGSHYVFFVSNSEKSIKDTLKHHLSSDDSNACIKSHLRNLKCFFRYAETEKKDLKNITRTIYEHFNPKCNLEVPEGEKIEVNIK